MCPRSRPIELTPRLAVQPMPVWLATLVLTASCIGPVQAEILVGVAGPITGRMAWVGDTVKTGAEMALADINDAGGLLGERLAYSFADDYCDPEQTIAAANKLVHDGVAAVFGHPCSAAAIPASNVYSDAKILLFSSVATNPMLTERGLRNVFRMVGRDDRQGAIAGDYLAEHWGNQKIAILHDGPIYGQGLAEEVRKHLHDHGFIETLYEAVTPGITDYSDIVRKLQNADTDVIYFDGFAPEAALIIRQAKLVLPHVQLLSGDALGNEDFWLIAKAASQGALFTRPPDARDDPAAARVVAKFREVKKYEPVGATLGTYAAVQVWAQAVEKAGSLEFEAVIGALRNHEFDTAIGIIGFDSKGDVIGRRATFTWYVWQDDDFVPAGVE